MRGNPSNQIGGFTKIGVYPRACGETEGELARIFVKQGLSPRMRGNHNRISVRIRRLGSIPAHAGKPWFAASIIPRFGVYPRACGETPVGFAL